MSYSHTYKPSDREIVATIPFGYAEGLSRKSSGNIVLKHRKRFYTQIGTICMNLSTYLVDSSVHIGDEVEIISNDSSAKNSLLRLAEVSDTIVYESLVKLDRGIRREIM
ncbi:MAG: alanine racemase C-terminal domain-containing protein [bacterium]